MKPETLGFGTCDVRVRLWDVEYILDLLNSYPISQIAHLTSLEPVKRIDNVMSDSLLRQTVDLIARYYDNFKVGYVGHEGYRKSTDLLKFARCIDELVRLDLIDPKRTLFIEPMI